MRKPVDGNGVRLTLIPAVAVLIFCLCLFMAAPASCANAADGSSADTVRVGYFENEIFQEGAGEGLVRSGYAYDYYRKLSEYTGWEYEYIYGDFADLYQMLLDGRIDMLAGLAWTEERSELIGYPELAMGSETYNMVKHAADDSVTASFATLNGKRIGVLDSAMVGVLERFIDEHSLKCEVVKFPGYQAMMEAFDNADIDALVAESDGTSDRDNAELLYAFGNSDYYLCVSRNRSDLLDKLNAAQAQLMAEEPNYINSLRIKYYSSSISSKHFSQAEKEWLSENDTLSIGYLNHYMPYSDTDADGAATGLVSELVPLIIKELGINGIKVSYEGFESYDDMIAAVRDGSVDAAFPVGGGLYFSEENGIYQSNAVVSTGTELIYSGEYNDAKLKRIAANENNRMQYYYIRTYFPDAEIVFYKSIEECLDAVIKGRVESTTLNGIRANDILKNRAYRDLYMKQLGKNDNRCFGVCIGNEGLLKLFNRGVSIIGEDSIQSMAYRYVDSLYSYTVFDVLQDYAWIFALAAVAVAMLVVLFLYRESVSAKKSVIEKEKAGRILEEKNRELAVAVSEAENANKAKSYFLSAMSHDIRTPMNSILSMNEMVLRECDDEDILVYAEHIRSSGNTLLGLISDILDFSKIEAGKMEILPVDYELSSVLNDLVNMLQTRAEEKGLHIELSVDSSMPNYLNGDEIRIKQATTNLLTNAVKYTKEGTITFSMGYDEIEGEPDQIMLNVSVKDTGAGIREEDIGKLFEAFERLDESGNRNIEGTGLGITITQRLLMMMGSTLKVESEYGKGSVFSFSVRQKVCSHEPVGDFEQAFRRYVADRKRYKEKFTAPDARILVVDDMQENLTVVRNLLKRTKIRIDTAESGDECIKLASEKKYDLIFLDHMMPGKDGIETLKELKGLEHNPNHDTPKVCLTANAISGMRENYIAAGFDDYITKPVNPDRLEETIMHFLPDNLIEPPDEPSGADEGIEIPEFIYGIEGLDAEAGSKHCGSPENYLDALMSYQERVARNAEEIEGFWQDKDIRSLTVKIHGIKSTSRAIGAAGLGNTAEMLENAGNAEDVQLLEDKLDDFLTMYRALGDALSPLVKENGDDADKPLMDMEELNGIYRSLKKHAANYDYDDIAELGDYLEGFRVPDEEADKVRKIREAISEMDYDIIPELLG